MRPILVFAVLAMLAGCGPVTITTGDSITAEELERFFRKHRVDGNPAVALKKESAGVSYVVTVHGYPDNLSVCEELIAPYNEDSSLSTIPGSYRCDELQ